MKIRLLLVISLVVAIASIAAPAVRADGLSDLGFQTGGSILTLPPAQLTDPPPQGAAKEPLFDTAVFEFRRWHRGRHQGRYPQRDVSDLPGAGSRGLPEHGLGGHGHHERSRQWQRTRRGIQDFDGDEVLGSGRRPGGPLRSAFHSGESGGDARLGARLTPRQH